MKLMMKRRRWLAALGSGSVLAACGGGGDDGAAPPAGSGRWRAIGSGLAVSFHGTARLADGSMLVIGGSRGQPTVAHSIDRVDPATGTVTRVAELATGRAAMGVATLADGRILVAGGHSASSAWPFAELIDPLRGTVVAAGALTTPRNRHAMLRLADGRVLIAGGVERDSVELWDPATRQWRQVAQRMAHTREYPALALLADGRVLIVGGFTAATSYVFAEVFDPRTERFAPVADVIAERRIFHAAHRLADGGVIVIGGERSDGAAEPLAGVWRFDPALQRFVAQPSLQRVRTLAASLSYEDSVLLVGGEDAAGAVTEPWVWSAAVQRPLAPLPGPRAWHSVDRLADGRLIVIGGEQRGGYTREILIHDTLS